jgi:acyl-coenzyme A thioesterase PaaI-like protein
MGYSVAVRFRLALVFALALALAVPLFASAKVLTVVRSRTDANPSISASGFLETPKSFRVTVTSSKNMSLNGSTVSLNCSHGDHSKTRIVVIRGKPRQSKRIKPSMKHSQACFVSMSIVGDKPGRLTARLTGTKRHVKKPKPVAAAPTPDPVPDPAPTTP